MKKLVLSLLCATAVAGCTISTEAPAQERPNVTVIENHDGGLVMAHLDQLEEFVASRETLVIRGYCASACTFFLASPYSCMEPGTEFMFHGGTYEGDEVASETLREAYALIDRLMVENYESTSPALADWYNENARNLSGYEYASLSAEELANMGASRLCN